MTHSKLGRTSGIWSSTPASVRSSKSPERGSQYRPNTSCITKNWKSNCARYLGVDLSNNLSFNNHVDRICNSVNKTLGFLRRNLRVNDKKLKTISYQAAVRPVLEYCSSCWDPYTPRNTQKLEMVQRRAARRVTGDWRQTSSVTRMLEELSLRSLALCRSDARLIMLFKIVHGMAAIPSQLYLPQPGCSTRGPRPHTFPQIQTTRDYFKYSFFPLTIVQWNALPPDIPALLTLDGFKAAVCSIAHQPQKVSICSVYRLLTFSYFNHPVFLTFLITIYLLFYLSLPMFLLLFFFRLAICF